MKIKYRKHRLAKVGLFLFGFIISFGLFFFINSEQQNQNQGYQDSSPPLGHESRNSKGKSVGSPRITNEISADEGRDLLFESRMVTALAEFHRDPIFGIGILAEMGLTEDALVSWFRVFLEESERRGNAIDLQILLEELVSIDGGGVKNRLLGSTAAMAVRSGLDTEELVSWLSANSPGTLVSVSSQLWNKNEDSAASVFSSLEGEAADFFLIGAIGSRKTFSSPTTIETIVTGIRAMTRFSAVDRNIFEAQFLTTNLTGNADLVEKYLRDSHSEEVRNKLLPRLAREKFGDDYESAFQWALDLEGGVKTAAVSKVEKDWISSKEE